MVEAKHTEEKGRYNKSLTGKIVARNRNRGCFELTLPHEEHLEELNPFQDQIALRKFFSESKRRKRSSYYSIALTKPK